MHHKGVGSHLLTDRGALSVTRVDDRLRRQGVDAVLDRKDERRHRSTGKIAASDTAVEERVTGEQVRSNPEAHRPARMSRCVHDLDVEVMPAKHLAVSQVLLADDIGQVVGDTGKVSNRLELFAIVGMDRRLAAECRFERRDATDMIGMPVGEQDAITTQSALFQQRDRLRMLQPRVDDQRIGRVPPAQHVAVLVKRGINDDGQLDEVSQRLGHDGKTTRDRR